ncbi:MAG: glycoside-pentoside-hexuronide (GPH):cation symporter [Oscillospiraceae bacterium]|jgi:GPH family glycoside/pentoside/hexuronide:cation symporter|nr:glycoside-pentoside-hexuronide (GPH):cation symporter [Oscillospiraceae bacterium]
MEQKSTMITFWDKIGYALGDMGGQFTFGLVGSFLSMFYTDVLGILPKQIALLMLVARVWDAVNDPIWGSLIDRRRPRGGVFRHGKFRPYLLGAAPLLSVSAILMFANPGLGPVGSLVWAYSTYIAYGMTYTSYNIPYGSLASVISPLEQDRTALSIFRSMGAGLGALPAMVLLPLFVYSKNAAGNQYLDSRKLWLAAAVLALGALGIQAASYFLTKERVEAPPAAEKQPLSNTFKTLAKNRPFLVLCLVSMLLIALTMYTQTVNSYLFKDYFHQPAFYSLYSICTYAPMALLLPFLGKLTRRFGKKELCAAGLLLSALVFFLTFALRLRGAVPYLALCFFSGMGQTCLTMEIWALVTDVIDYQYLLSGRREEGTAYSFYSFFRKLGQTLAGSGGAVALRMIGYEVSSGMGLAQTTQVAAGMYRLATIVPAAACMVMFLLLSFAYPLGKAKLRDMQAALLQTESAG